MQQDSPFQTLASYGLSTTTMGVIPAFCMSSSSKLLFLSIVKAIIMHKCHAKVVLLFSLSLDMSFKLKHDGTRGRGRSIS